MPNEKKPLTAEDIYNVIMRQDFKDWHDKKLENHVSGWGNPTPTRGDIIADIKKMFAVD